MDHTDRYGKQNIRLVVYKGDRGIFQGDFSVVFLGFTFLSCFFLFLKFLRSFELVYCVKKKPHRLGF